MSSPQKTPSRLRALHHAAARVALRCLVAVALLLVYELLWGKLFPFSPVALGFERHELTHTVVFVQSGAAFRDFSQVDGLIPEVERTHALGFLRKPRLFVFRDAAAYLRRSPSRARFCAFPGGALVISPWAQREAREGRISLSIYLTHELSHVLIFQHAGFLRSLRLPKWLLEGLATYTAHQMGTSFYPDKQRTYRLLSEGNFMPPLLFNTRVGDQIELHVKYPEAFAYSEFGCLVDYLIQTRGRDRFQGYLGRLIEGDDQAAAFDEAYGMALDQAVGEFMDHVRQAAKHGEAAD
ncbi:MAG: hypothetical protein ABFE07_19865 [Armatimonadia bacterium]